MMLGLFSGRVSPPGEGGLDGSVNHYGILIPHPLNNGSINKKKVKLP
jgi:hypothetical protein